MNIQALINARRPGYSLDRAFYTNDEIFETDLEVIFGRHWIYVGVDADVPQPGNVVTVDIGRHAILILRHNDCSVRAYHNVCRHRGARLVAGPAASVGNIVCRYHQWTYNLDGALIFAEHMPPDFDRACHGLKPVHVRSVSGLLFICLADHAPADIDDMERTLAPYLERHAVRDTKIAAQIDLLEEGNWKVTMENNRECYHCAVSHPELTVSLFEHGFGFAPESGNPAKLDAACRYDALSARMKAAWEADGFPSAEVEHLADRVTGFRTERLPLDGTGESQTLDTRAACRKLLGTLVNPVLGGLSMWTQPNSWHHFMADHIVTFAVFPVSPERTLLRTKWLVHKDAQEGTDYTVEKLTAVWRATNNQDGALVGLQQSGARTTGYQPGPYSPFTEGLVDKFTTWYIGRLRAHLAPGPQRFPASAEDNVGDDRPSVVSDIASETSLPPPIVLEATEFQIELTRRGRTIVCRSDQTILQAASAAGIRLPFACSHGMCGTCKSRLVSGRVEMQHEGGITQGEIDRGMILVCCSKPLEDLKIER